MDPKTGLSLFLCRISNEVKVSHALVACFNHCFSCAFRYFYFLAISSLKTRTLCFCNFAFMIYQLFFQDVLIYPKRHVSYARAYAYENGYWLHTLQPYNPLPNTSTYLRVRRRSNALYQLQVGGYWHFPRDLKEQMNKFDTNSLIVPILKSIHQNFNKKKLDNKHTQSSLT